MAVTNRGSRRVQQTYRVVFSHNGPSGDALEIVGSSGRTVVVREIVFSKPSAAVTLAIIKRSSADTGTATARTGVPLDSSFAAASATIKAYTVAPGTAGTVLGTVDLWSVGTADVLVRDFSGEQSSPIYLRSTAETLALNISGTATVTGSIEWTEE